LGSDKKFWRACCYNCARQTGDDDSPYHIKEILTVEKVLIAEKMLLLMYFGESARISRAAEVGRSGGK
jgi:hypothetical protein